ASVPRLYSTEPRRNGNRIADDEAFIESTILRARRAGRGLSTGDQEDPTLLMTRRLAHILRAGDNDFLRLAASRPTFFDNHPKETGTRRAGPEFPSPGHSADQFSRTVNTRDIKSCNRGCE